MIRSDETFQALSAEHKRHGGGPCTLVLFDLDDFFARVAPLQDHAREELLESIVRWLKDHMPGTPSVYRHGRDSWVAAYWGIQTNEILRDLYAWHETFSGVEFSTPTAVGKTFTFTAAVAEFPTHGEALRDVLRAVEDTLFQGKSLGKNRILLVTPQKMVTKTSYYTPWQLRRLSHLARRLETTDAQLLREALDDLIWKYHV